jgi:hypothetical protein
VGVNVGGREETGKREDEQGGRRERGGGDGEGRKRLGQEETEGGVLTAETFYPIIRIDR